MAYQPWDSESPRRRYVEALSRNPNRAFLGSFTFLASEEKTELRALMEWWFGRPLAEESAEYFWSMVPDGVDRKRLHFEEATSEEIQSGAGLPTVGEEETNG